MTPLLGEGVVLAQRVEQFADPGGVCVTGAIQEALPTRLPFDQGDLGEQQVKGFDKPVHIYAVRLKKGAALPGPTISSQVKQHCRNRLSYLKQKEHRQCNG